MTDRTLAYSASVKLSAQVAGSIGNAVAMRNVGRAYGISHQPVACWDRSKLWSSYRCMV